MLCRICCRTPHIDPQFTSLWLNRITGIAPRIKATEEWMNVLVTMFHQNLRHTGAGGFMRSGTVGDNGAVRWNIRKVFLHLIRRHTGRPR
jgi:hypothetical protein